MSDDPLLDQLLERLREQARGRKDWIESFLERRASDAAAEVERVSPATVRVTADEGSFEISVYLRPPPPPPTGLRPWEPQRLKRAGENVGELAYIVVDGIVGGRARLSVSPWPQVDDKGRLRFADDAPTRLVYADVGVLADFVQSSLEPGQRYAGEIAIGNVFAARVRDGGEPESGPTEPPTEMPEDPPRPDEWISPPVYDVSGPARAKAQVAFYGAVSPALKPRVVREIDRESRGEAG